MKIIQIAGFLGSGKTSTLIAISKIMDSKLRKRVAFIVNEIGDAPVDAKVLEDYGFKVSSLGGGCVCCEIIVNLKQTLEALQRTMDPDIVLIEPTGVAVPDMIKEGLSANKSKWLEVGPAIVLYDPLMDDEMLSGSPQDNFIARQIASADLVAVSKVDAVNEERIVQCERRARELNALAPVIRVSALRCDGMYDLLKFIIGDSDGQR
jgi:G3E family GTPase